VNLDLDNDLLGFRKTPVEESGVAVIVTVSRAVTALAEGGKREGEQGHRHNFLKKRFRHGVLVSLVGG
jgi:hypothetical protein